MMATALTIIIPAYNEEQNLKKGVLTPFFSYLESRPAWEAVFVNDGSTDKTLPLLKSQIARYPSLHLRLLTITHGGKSRALIAGTKKAKGECVLFTDFDQSTPLSEAPKLINKLDRGFDIVVGKRVMRQSSPLTRSLTSRGFKLLRNLLFSIPVSDTQSGFKLFKSSALKALLPKTLSYRSQANPKGYHTAVGFDLELFILAAKMNLKVAEVPVAWSHRPKSINLPALSLRSLFDLLRVKLLLLRGYYRER